VPRPSSRDPVPRPVPGSPTKNPDFHDGPESPIGLQYLSPVWRRHMQLARVVLGVDLTEASTRAAKWVANEFAPDAEIMLLHCLNPLLLQRQSAEARSAADGFLRELTLDIGGPRSSYRIRIGDAARCL